MKLLVGTLIDGRCSGIDSYLLDVLAVARRQSVHLDFLTNEIDPELQDRLDKLGSVLYQTPSLKNPPAQYRAIRRLIEQGNYDAAYFNVSEPLNCVGALAAHKCGLPVIVHSHGSASVGGSAAVRAFRGFISCCCRPVLNACADTKLACSRGAARYLYGRRAGEATVVYNPVDADRFAFDPALRRQVREELGLHDEIVLGHVGGFRYPKNQGFLLELAARLTADGHPVTLLFAGSGPDEPALKERARAL
ncbi:MAG: glycosyltransferase, partial [Clostridia bacterium]|nr:glycosyltransferase [Clostridia bacterium]